MCIGCWPCPSRRSRATATGSPRLGSPTTDGMWVGGLCRLPASIFGCIHDDKQTDDQQIDRPTNQHNSFAEALAARRKAMQQQALAAGNNGGGIGNGGSASASKRKNSRERRESEVMVPWADVNADITCEHGGLRPVPKQGSGGGNGGSGGGGGGSRSSSASPTLSGSGGGSLGGGGGSCGGLLMGRRKLIEKRAWKVRTYGYLVGVGVGRGGWDAAGE